MAKQANELATELEQLSGSVSQIAQALDTIAQTAQQKSKHPHISNYTLLHIHNNVLWSLAKNSSSPKISFLISGKLFQTTRATLQAEPNTLLTLAETANCEEIILDRDAKCFGLILNYLRGAVIDTYVSDHMELEQLQLFWQEVTFYGIASLLKRKAEIVSSKLHWKSCHHYLQISENQCTVTVTNAAETNLACFGNRVFSSGIHKWNIRINKMQGEQWIGLGVCVHNEFSHSTSGQWTRLYGATSHGFKLQHDNGVSGFPAWKEQQVIPLVLDCNAGILHVASFQVTVPTNTLLVPAALLSLQNTSVTIV